MTNRILITGASGVVGRALRTLLSPSFEVDGLDLAGPPLQRGDVRDADRVRRAVHACDGVIHLAAVSRVSVAERDPAACHATNVGGLRNVLDAAAVAPQRPWLLFASSREVYGELADLPATETAPLRPANVYGRSKAAGEALVRRAARDGVRTAIVRLSNVYGSPDDHSDRVVPAFARAAVEGRPLRVEGGDRIFDFTHLDDVTCGIASLVRLLLDGRSPPPVHLVSGVPITLRVLADLTVEVAASRSAVRAVEPRPFDVARFVGDPARARAILGWAPHVPLHEGLARLVRAFHDDLIASIQAGAR